MERYTYILLFICILLCVQSCTFSPQLPSYQLKLIKTYPLDSNISKIEFSDLNQDNADELILVSNYRNNQQSIMIQNQNMEIYSQITLTTPVKSINTLYNEYDKSEWLFYCIQSGNMIYLKGIRYNWQKPLSRDEYSYEKITRSDPYIDNPKINWGGTLTPRFIRDIDDDKIVEVVCTGSDGFTTNPRGLYVYELLSGKLKWKLETAANITSVIQSDFNLDGKQDIICSTSAIKNTEAIINGISDFSPAIIVCDGSGQIIHLQKCFDGFGAVILANMDVDNDGKKEIIQCDRTWGTDNIKNSISIIASNGTGFYEKRRYDAQSAIIIPDQLLVRKLDNSSKQCLFFIEKDNGLVVLDSNLNPLKHDFKQPIKSIEDIRDINNDDYNEIVVLTEDNAFLVLDNKLQVKAILKDPQYKDGNAKASVIHAGLGTHRIIAVTGNQTLAYYAYQPLPWYYLFIKYIRAEISLITIFLLLIAVWLAIRLMNTIQTYRFIMYQSKTGLMIVQRKAIIFINPVIRKLLFPDMDSKPDAAMLKKYQPDLYQHLSAFLKGKTQYQIAQVVIYQNPPAERLVSYYLVPELMSKVLIVIHALDIKEDDNDSKIQWAEVSRRLAHHVRRHISNILLGMEILETNPSETEQRNKKAMINSELDKIKRFTQAFQRFSELDDFQTHAIDLIPWIDQCISRIKLPENITIIRDWSLDSAMALVDPIRFEEAIMNLIINSTEAMQSGGIIRISVTEKNIRIHERYILIEIEDNGKGIPTKYISDIWQPFFTTKQGGTGIGLPEVKKIVTSMQGIIEIMSEENVGTTVSILLKGPEL